MDQGKSTGLVFSNFYPLTEGGTSKDLHGELMLSFYTRGMEEGAVNVKLKAKILKKKEKSP